MSLRTSSAHSNASYVFKVKLLHGLDYTLLKNDWARTYSVCRDIISPNTYRDDQSAGPFRSVTGH